MPASQQKPFCLADYEGFVRTLHESGVPGVLIGGLAVAAWAEIHLTAEDKALFELPIYSKDIDLRGEKMTMRFLAKDMELAGAEITGFVAATRKNAPHMGQVHAASVHWRGHRTTIEVLERLPGLDSGKDSPVVGTRLIARDGLPLLDPCSLFICKLHAANTRPEETVNNDIMHLRILARVIPRFLERIRATALPEYNANEDAQRLMKQLEACESGTHDFRVPLSPEETAELIGELRNHLNAEA